MLKKTPQDTPASNMLVEAKQAKFPEAVRAAGKDAKAIAAIAPNNARELSRKEKTMKTEAFSTWSKISTLSESFFKNHKNDK